jgi:hypothetical protein
MRLIVGIGVVLTLALAADGVAATPQFSAPIQLDQRGGTEPRVTILGNDHRFVVTTTAADGATVYRSTDRGASWGKTKADLPGQTNDTIDVDIVGMPDGRILASELDLAGINFPSAVSDDEGDSWKQAVGSTQLVDQDRQWFAVGPQDPATGKSRVYLLYHNLASGFGNHNMLVATSTDGGETFGPPVPTTLPGQDAYADLQCADSGGPSSIAVNQKTGRIYVFFTTRAAPLGPIDGGGCASRPIEVNIVSGTRVWVTSSPDGSAGSWTPSLAVDDSNTGQVVSMQLAYGALDNQGGVWVAYPETPNPYPDLTGAAVKLTHADADMKTWSQPVTLVPAGGPGSLLVHLAVGDPGKIDVAYFKGEGALDKPGWYPHVIQSLDAGGASPTVTDTKLSDAATYAESATLMMGACSDPDDPAAGIENGFTCDRSTDVWGIAMDADCNLTVTWPGRKNDINKDADGTYVATQTGGSRICGSTAEDSGNPQAQFCHDDAAPQVTRSRRQIRASRRRLRITGRASDHGCANGQPDQPVHGTIVRVQVAVARMVRNRCAFLSRQGAEGPPRLCRRTRFLTARGTERWQLGLRGHFRPGRYRMYVRAFDRTRNRSAIGRRVRFRIR